MAEPRELDVTINKDDYQDEIQRVLRKSGQLGGEKIMK